MSRSERPSFVHRVVVGAVTLAGSVLLGVLVGAAEGRHDRTTG
jgi:hypothetical protein